MVDKGRINKASKFAAARFGVETLKPEQEGAIRGFLKGSDVFVCLPTGYGKPLCFGLLPLVYDYLRGLDTASGSMSPTSIVVCVVPLQSLMMDQYQRF